MIRFRPGRKMGTIFCSPSRGWEVALHHRLRLAGAPAGFELREITLDLPARVEEMLQVID